MSKKNDTKPNMKDFRTEASFKGLPFGEAYNPLIKKGVKNELMNLFIPTGEDEYASIGDIEIGSDGFLEIMFILNNQIIRIKRFPEGIAQIFIIGNGKIDDNKTDSNSEG